MTINQFTADIRALVRKAIEDGIDVNILIGELMDICDVLCGEPNAPTVTRQALGY